MSHSLIWLYLWLLLHFAA